MLHGNLVCFSRLETEQNISLQILYSWLTDSNLSFGSVFLYSTKIQDWLSGEISMWYFSLWLFSSVSEGNFFHIHCKELGEVLFCDIGAWQGRQTCDKDLFHMEFDGRGVCVKIPMWWADMVIEVFRIVRDLFTFRAIYKINIFMLRNLDIQMIGRFTRVGEPGFILT